MTTSPPNKPLDPYTEQAADWRSALKHNSRRTRLVIATFILIYICIGLLVDMYIYAGSYPQATLSQLFFALITFQLFPKVTLITLLVALVSLFVTFSFHDKLMLLGTEYREITPESAKSTQELQLYNVVEEMKVAAGLRFMPKVYLIEADYMNAFASGYSEKSAMVAITRGLIEKLDRSELQAVMAHELSHIRHMDIKLTLMASVLSNLTLIVLDILFYNAIFSGRRSDEEGNGRSRNQLLFIILILRWVLPLATILLMLYLSRTREYMADAGCVELTRDNEPLARALLKIQGDYQQNADNYSAASQATAHESIRRQAYLYDPLEAGIASTRSLADLFSTHPPIEKRLQALGFTMKKGQ
ncbi:MAG TPA: zinc metalloprotease HtpX [Gammaproteobacteria bacterium]|nr:zinc metalloprotease HtpX [Gammaproteobacteria bacterium]